MSVLRQSALTVSRAHKIVHDIAVAISMLLPLVGLVYAFYYLFILFPLYPVLILAAIVVAWVRRYAMMSGISLVYHRWGTHGSCNLKEWLAFFIGAQGCMTLQGTLVKWIVDHWIHHEKADRDGDPHSPHDKRWVSECRQFLHGHCLWFYWLFNPQRRPIPDPLREEMTAHFMQNRVIRVLSNPYIYFGCVLGGALTASLCVGIIALLAYGPDMFWTGCWVGFLWGGLVPIVDVNHSTYCVNSVCHKWGYKNFKNDLDHSVNNWFVAFLTHGEGFHGNHHAKPQSANHGMKGLERLLDHTAWQLSLFERLGWADKVEFTDESEFSKIQEVLNFAAKRAELLTATAP